MVSIQSHGKTGVNTNVALPPQPMLQSASCPRVAPFINVVPQKHCTLMSEMSEIACSPGEPEPETLPELKPDQGGILSATCCDTAFNGNGVIVGQFGLEDTSMGVVT